MTGAVSLNLSVPVNELKKRPFTPAESIFVVLLTSGADGTSQSSEIGLAQGPGISTNPFVSAIAALAFSEINGTRCMTYASISSLIFPLNPLIIGMIARGLPVTLMSFYETSKTTSVVFIASRVRSFTSYVSRTIPIFILILFRVTLAFPEKTEYSYASVSK